ncbi:hypothetical protein [Xanthocytophaga agilis]|uniref:Uncharacterized protein n=1 Tax=Xanthocytophaga agilis TaxID=3048010 RepID=A0AAE3RBH4_9BACT|nr:hypothetical protein [Xanthocytophaga agilis]MDJ1505165.1 hypothetical protein [Xanthocytophaga agilis]
MKFKFNSRGKNFVKRNLIKKDEGKLTYVQLFGFLLITLGITYFASFLLPSGIIDIFPFLKLDEHPESTEVPIAFFTIMLGVAFAFPDMLKGQTKDISTMRIVVFMFANVICMLILKVGWDKHSLTEIGLDGFWIGVIAFLFGAKATQAYFENAKSFSPNSITTPDINDNALTKAEISRLAVIQNRDVLLVKYPNIESVSDTLKKGDSCVTIYVKDNQTASIPKEVDVTLKSGSVLKVPTEIVADTGIAKPHIGQATDELSDSNSPDYFGSICCIVESTTNNNFKGVVTAGHVFTYGDYFNYGGVLGQNQKRDVLLNGNPKATLFFQQMKFNQDIAIAELEDKSNLLNNYISFGNVFYKVSENDLNSATPNATIASRQNNKRDVFILDFNVSFEIKYFNLPRYIRDIILIGSTNDRTTSQTVSVGGDSGSCVYHKATGKLIGLLLGGNNKFTFVLPIQETLNSFNFRTV